MHDIIKFHQTWPTIAVQLIRQSINWSTGEIYVYTQRMLWIEEGSEFVGEIYQNFKEIVWIFSTPRSDLFVRGSELAFTKLRSLTIRDQNARRLSSLQSCFCAPSGEHHVEFQWSDYMYKTSPLASLVEWYMSALRGGVGRRVHVAMAC